MEEVFYKEDFEFLKENVQFKKLIKLIEKKYQLDLTKNNYKDNYIWGIRLDHRFYTATQKNQLVELALKEALLFDEDLIESLPSKEKGEDQEKTVSPDKHDTVSQNDGDTGHAQ